MANYMNNFIPGRSLQYDLLQSEASHKPLELELELGD